MAAASRGHCDRRWWVRRSRARTLSSTSAANSSRSRATNAACSVSLPAFVDQQVDRPLALLQTTLDLREIRLVGQIGRQDLGLEVVAGVKLGRQPLEWLLAASDEHEGCSRAANARASASPIPAEPPVMSARAQPGLRRV